MIEEDVGNKETVTYLFTTSANVQSRSSLRVRVSSDSPVNDSLLFLFDDHGIEEDRQARSEMDGPRRAEREKEASKLKATRVNTTQFSLKANSKRKKQRRITTGGRKSLELILTNINDCN